MTDLIPSRRVVAIAKQAKRNADLFACALAGQIDSRQWADHLRAEPGLREFVLREYERTDAIARRRRQN